MAKVRNIKGREGYFLDYRLKDGTRIIKKASRSNRRGAEKELALIVSELERMTCPHQRVQVEC